MTGAFCTPFFTDSGNPSVPAVSEAEGFSHYSGTMLYFYEHRFEYLMDFFCTFPFGFKGFHVCDGSPEHILFQSDIAVTKQVFQRSGLYVQAFS